MGPEDIRWQKDDSRMDPVTYLRSRGAPSSGGRMPTSHAGPMPGPGRGRGFQKNVSKKDFPPPGNGVGKRSSDDIEMLHTESLMKVVENVLSVSNPDRLEVEKAKKAIKVRPNVQIILSGCFHFVDCQCLQDQEQSLTDAIERLAEASDGESG
uniref:Rif1 n=1 Tax=Arundo donax TaxID=35708 RepID=A0A0A8ZIL9_ARUDO